MDELRELLEQVSDTYDDFVDGICCTLRHHEYVYREKVMDYIKEDPSRTTSDIIEYLDVLGI